MAVKVMVAPAIARGELERGTQARKRTPPAGGKRRRRRSAVYDADGNEVLITLMCLKCHKMRPLSLFGLRRMSDGSIRNQPWCRNCRSGGGAEKGNGAAGEVATAAELSSLPDPASQDERPRRNTAAEIAAALAAGRG